uniref:Uncharacterized protein n=1 Tax=Arundo donax TaxID=35708 RepID=A0A0A9BPE3_ARUDO
MLFSLSFVLPSNLYPADNNGRSNCLQSISLKCIFLISGYCRRCKAVLVAI